MAVNADSVVVELVAENEKFDAAVKESAKTYNDSMNTIERSATKGENAHKKLTASVGNSRIAMLEFQHIARGTMDQVAAGAPLTQVLAQHMGMLGEAVALAGGSFGKLGAFMGGPLGIAVTAAITGIALLIHHHHEESDALEETVEKLRKRYEQTLLNKDADAIFARTIEGSIAKIHELTDELDKQNLTLEDNINLKKAAIGIAVLQAQANQQSTAQDLRSAIQERTEAQKALL